MIGFIYNLLIYCFKGATSIAAVFNSKAKSRVNGLNQQKNKLTKIPDNLNHDRVLIHCASLGELEQALPLIRWILNNTEHHIFISFFSPSGYENYHPYNDRITKTYLPFDTVLDMSHFIGKIKPCICIIIKNEWWWNFINTLQKHSIPTHLVSSTFRANHYFIKYPVAFFKNSLNTLSDIHVVNPSSKNQVSKIYNGAIFVSGDTRIDQVNYLKSQNKGSITNTSKNKETKTIIYGSVWPQDAPYINELIEKFKGYNHLIYPHELDTSTINWFTNNIKDAEVVNKTSEVQNGVFIISSMGELKFAYKNAHIAYIGGGFGVGIHNILEAAVYEISTLFGPNYLKSAEAIQLIELKCAFTFGDKKELSNIITNLQSKEVMAQIKKKLNSYFSVESSPTHLICQKIFR